MLATRVEEFLASDWELKGSVKLMSWTEDGNGGYQDLAKVTKQQFVQTMVLRKRGSEHQ